MVGRVIGKMLHQMRQAHLRLANREHSSQYFVCKAADKLSLYFLDFRPLHPNRSDVRKYARPKKGVVSSPQLG